MSDAREIGVPDLFLLRVPLLTLSAWREARSTDPLAVLNGPLGDVIRGALRLAYPSSFDKLMNQLSAPDISRREAAIAAIRRMIVRLSTRPEPFGLSAGFAIGRVGASAHPAVDSLGGNAIIQEGAYTPPEAGESGVDGFLVNPTLLRDGATMRFTVKTVAEDGRIAVVIRSIRCTRPMSELARIRGVVSQEAIADIVKASLGQPVAETTIKSYVSQLLKAGVLQDAQVLERLVLDPPPIKEVTSGSTLRVDAMQLTSATLRDFSADISFASVETLERVNATLVLPDEPVLSRQQVRDVRGAVNALHRLYMRNSESLAIRRFREDFENRFGEGPVPLLAALDPDLGIPFAGEALKSTGAAPGWLKDNNSRREAPISEGSVDHPLAELLYNESSGVQCDSVDISSVVERIGADDKALPLPPGLVASLRTSTELLASSQSLPWGWLQSATGVWGTELFGRFSFVSERLADRIRDRYEQLMVADDIAYAEIIHIEAPRSANVIRRPDYGCYQLPLLGAAPTVPPSRVINPNEITVSLVDGSLVLYSPRLQKVVQPVMTNAHAFNRADFAVYRFLCSLQAQHFHTPLFFDWGPFGRLKHLPRVTWRDRILLAPRSWLLPREVFLSRSAKLASEVILDLCRKQLLPRVATIGIRDVEEVVELDNRDGAEELARAARGRGFPVRVEEAFGLSSINRDTRIAQVLLPLAADAAKRPIALKRLALSHLPEDSDWTYLKIYATPTVIDELLHSHELFVDLWRLLDPSSIFFVRYRDPGFHLRLRWRRGFDADNHIDSILSRCIDDLIDSGRVSAVTRERYRPESYRYGGRQLLSVVENLFCQDSYWTWQLLRRAVIYRDPQKRWDVGLHLIDSTLNAIGLDDKLRWKYYRAMERSMPSTVRAAVSPAVRGYLKEKRFTELWLPPIDEESSVLIGKRLTAARRTLDEPSTGADPRSLSELASSIVHMTLNRLFRDDSRRLEAAAFLYAARASSDRCHVHANPEPAH